VEALRTDVLCSDSCARVRSIVVSVLTCGLGMRDGQV
jgi:hypothetical protein